MQVHSFAAARDSRVSHDNIHKIREWNFRIKGAIKRLNRNRKEFGDATGPSKEQTRREKDEGDEEEEKEEDRFLPFYVPLNESRGGLAVIYFLCT